MAKTQLQMVREHLEAGKTLTPLEALDMFHCFRLADVVFKLRKAGLPVITEDQHTADGRTFARYSLCKAEPLDAPKRLRLPVHGTPEDAPNAAPVRTVRGDGTGQPLPPCSNTLKTAPAVVCRWRWEGGLLDGCRVTSCGKNVRLPYADWDYCPYCGRKIERV